jgi:cell wall-associated NlpC family hydrolase
MGRRVRETLQVARGVADVWLWPRRGEGEEDRLSQGLLGWPAEVLEARDGWRRVRLPDYEGWVERAHLASPPAAATDRALVVTALCAPLYAHPTGCARLDDVYLGTVVPLLDAAGARWRVALPGGRTGWMDRTAGEPRCRAQPFPPRPAAHAVAVGRRLLGCRYLWGGGTCRGIDCSALVQLAYALCGVVLPRDADQQWDALPTPVERDALAPGDLLFFARGGAVIHVALSLGGPRFLHSLGVPDTGVCIQSLDPAAPDYNAHVAALYCGARRVIPV